MFGIIKKIFLFIFRVRKDAGVIKGDILPNIESNKLKLESIEELNLNLNQSNLKQNQEQKGNPLSQKLKIFFNKFLSKSEKPGFTSLKIKKKITYWKIRTKITLTSVQEISEIQLRNSLNQKIKSFLRDLFESNPIKQKLMSYFYKKEETKPVKKEGTLSLSFKTDPNESINIINAYLYKQGLKEKIRIFSSKEYEKLQKINKRIEYEKHGKFLEFEAKKRREFREKNSRIFEILTDSSADYVSLNSINQKRFFDVLSHSFLEVSKTLPEIKTKIKNLEKHQRQRETKMHERILLGFGDHIKANDHGLDFYKNSLDEIHVRFKEIEKNIRVLKKKDRDLSNLTSDEFLQERLFGFEKWMKFQNSKLVKLNKDYEFQNKTLSGVINHIQKECEVQFGLAEDQIYNLQSCFSFSINDLDAQIQNLRKISLKNAEDLSQILNQNIFINFGVFGKIIKGFRDFTKSFINSNKTPEILDDSGPKISEKYSDSELVKDSKVKSHGGLVRDFELKAYYKYSNFIELVASKTVLLLGKFSNFFKSKVLKAPKDFFISSKKFLKNIFSRR